MDGSSSSLVRSIWRSDHFPGWAQTAVTTSLNAACDPGTGTAFAVHPLPSRVAPVTAPPPWVTAPPPTTASPLLQLAVADFAVGLLGVCAVAYRTEPPVAAAPALPGGPCSPFGPRGPVSPVGPCLPRGPAGSAASRSE